MSDHPTHTADDAVRPEPVTFFSKGRREFLSRLGIGAGVVAIGYQGAASLRSLVPNVSYDAPTTVKLGLPLDFPDGLKFLPDMRLFVFREGKVFHAISAVCTHLGCTVRAEASLRPDPSDADARKATQVVEFACPCHGSRYDADGSNLSGPAPRPLAAFRLALAPDDGQLIVNLDDDVAPDIELTVP